MSLNLQNINKKKTATNQQKFDLSNWLSRDISFTKNKINDKEKEGFYHELYSLLQAGIDVKTSLELIKNENTKSQIARTLTSICQSVISGAPLSLAMHKSGMFSPYEYYSIEIGEETGRLLEIINDLGKYYGKRQKQRRLIISALSYPALILSISILAVSFMLFYMVPMFADVFKRFGGKLPKITQAVINMSTSLNNHLGLILTLTITILVCYQFLKNKIWFKRIKSRVIITTPMLGSLYLSSFLSKFCSSMSLLISSKVQLIRSIELVGQMTNFHPLEEAIPSITKELTKGTSLHESLKMTGIFNNKFLTMIKIGEEVNQLDRFFSQLGNQYTDDIEHRTSLLNTFLEPLLIIFLGVVVGFILITMYLPMFQISTNLGL